jgi:hypothetical protein
MLAVIYFFDQNCFIWFLFVLHFQYNRFLANPKECFFAKIIRLTFAFAKKFCLTSHFVDKFNNNYVDS